MAPITWDKTGERRFEAGIDRGVIYIPSKRVVVGGISYPAGFPWNGLVSVDIKQQGQEVTPIYYNGVKTLDLLHPGEFSASLTALTYPDELMGYDGYLEFEPGASVDSQYRDSFNLCYRTKVGTDLDSDAGYKIHVIYNITAVASDTSYATVDSNIAPVEFSWDITSVPIFTGRRPASHIIFDSTKIEPDVFAQIELTLYGSSTIDARLPTISELLGYVGLFFIGNNETGVWLAAGPDALVFMLDSTSFQINSDKVTMVDANTYEIQSTW